MHVCPSVSVRTCEYERGYTNMCTYMSKCVRGMVCVRVSVCTCVVTSVPTLMCVYECVSEGTCTM